MMYSNILLPLVTSDKIILPFLHIELGVVKNFVKACKQRNKVYIYLKEIRIGDMKIKEGIFINPQIINLYEDARLDSMLGKFSLFVNRRVTLGCNMSLNVRLPHSSMDKGERFHQEISNMEKT
uniref:Uncharacterized protein n=1 Tax=Glossina morsitans morsitans TaxID=37546 RepID=A0A1B0GCR7_GLOMM